MDRVRHPVAKVIALPGVKIRTMGGVHYVEPATALLLDDVNEELYSNQKTQWNLRSLPT